MSLEDTLVRIAVALETIAKNGGSVGGAASGKAGATSTGTAKTTTTAKKPVHTREELTAIAGTYREKTSKEKARDLIKEKGGVDKLAELPEAKIDALFAAFEEAIAAADEAGSSAGGDDDM